MLSIGRIYGPGGVRAAAKHNLRELAAEIGTDSHIDAARIKDNFILLGQHGAADVALEARMLMEKAGVTKVRKNAVMALELLFMLPPQTSVDIREYFERATSWAKAYFAVPALSSVVHLDESAPHCHVLLLPLVNGKMNGSDLHGGKAQLWAMQKSFHEEVSAPYGFVRQEPRKRASVTSRAAAMKQLRNYFQVNSKMSANAIQALLTPHAQDPHTLLHALGIPEQPLSRAPKSFVEIMTAPCKPERRSASQHTVIQGPWAINGEEPRDSIPYTCVGKGSPLKMSPPIGHIAASSLQTESTVKRVGQAGDQQAYKHRGTMSACSSLNNETARLLLCPRTGMTGLDCVDLSLRLPSQPEKLAMTQNFQHGQPTLINAAQVCNPPIGLKATMLPSGSKFAQAITRSNYRGPRVARGRHKLSTRTDAVRPVMSYKELRALRRCPLRLPKTTPHAWRVHASVRHPLAVELLNSQGRGVRDPPG